MCVGLAPARRVGNAVEDQQQNWLWAISKVDCLASSSSLQCCHTEFLGRLSTGVRERVFNFRIFNFVFGPILESWGLIKGLT